MWLALLAPAWLDLDLFTQFMAKFWAPIVAAGAVALWWLAFSRVRWYDRLLGVAAFAAVGAAASYLADFPFMVMLVFAVRVVLTAWVGWLLLTPFLSWPVRRVGLLAAFVLAWGAFDLISMDGIDGSMNAELRWRWSPTAEQKFQADLAARKPSGATAAAAQALSPGDWPGFRGPDRDGRRTGVRIAAGWTRNPQPLWRQRIGPGWGSFAVVGSRLYTQEQRGDDEAVVCYHTDTGGELWAHTYPARFSEIVAGPGPRATPTFHEGRIYALGAAGRLLCLDATTGEALWSADIVADSGAKVPQWGFSSSPLVAEGVVMVFAGGPDGKSVLGYNASSGDLAWAAGEGQLSYSSPQLARLDDSDQVLMATDQGLTSFSPSSGRVLWRYDLPLPQGGVRIIQPAVLGDHDVLIGAGFNQGSQRLRAAWAGDAWGVYEVWASKALSPYFNDLVVHQGFLYGFDGAFLTCVNLEDGERKWRVRGYGNGQVLLLADQGLLLVLSEKGEVALVEADPEKHREVGRFQAIEGKTWNHPVVAHGKLFVRNGEEVACYPLTADVAKTTGGR
jgi:outer membrane protein assembly factor BamB